MHNGARSFITDSCGEEKYTNVREHSIVPGLVRLFRSLRASSKLSPKDIDVAIPGKFSSLDPFCPKTPHEPHPVADLY